MTKIILVLALLAVNACAALKLSFYRWDTAAPGDVLAGHPMFWELRAPMWGFDATCTSGGTCTSANYTPTGQELLLPDDQQTPPGGIQNKQYGGPTNRPQYRAVNIGINGNAANTWNLYQCSCTAPTGGTNHCLGIVQVPTNGGPTQPCGVWDWGNASAAPVQVAITSTQTIRFYIVSGANSPPTCCYFNAYSGSTGFPAGTTFQYFYPSATATTFMKTTIAAPTHGALWMHVPGNVFAVTITFPGNTPPGPYNVGWNICTDTTYTNCTDLVFDVTVFAPPTMELNPPASIPPMPSFYDQPALCLSMLDDSWIASTDCSAKNIQTYGAATLTMSSYERGAAWYCNMANPDLYVELLAPASNGPRFLDLNAAPSDATSNCSPGGPGCLGFFYDGARAHYQLARWWNNPVQENCARAIANRVAKRGPIMPGWEPNRFSGLATSAQGVAPLYGVLGSYQCDPINAGCYLSAHSPSTLLNMISRGIEIGMGRWNGGVYSSTWVPSKYQPAMKAENFMDMWLEGLGSWSLPAPPANPATGFGPAGGFNANDGRGTGYILNVIQSYYNSGISPVAINPSTHATSLSGVGQYRQNQATAMITLMAMYGSSNSAITVSNRNTGQAATQPYMILSSMADSLVEYWEQTHDPAIPWAINRVLQQLAPLYSTAIGANNTSHGMPASSDNLVGPWCSGTAGAAGPSPTPRSSIWYVNSTVTNIGSCDQPYYSTLSLMYGWLYAWYWRHWTGPTGQSWACGTNYQECADEMFRAATVYRSPDLRQSAKNFYENQRHAIQYYKNRMGY